MGTFLELEGARDWIDETATHLGFQPADYVTWSYAALWKEYRRSHADAPWDMTFLSEDPMVGEKEP